MDCPTDETLRSFLSNAEQQTSSTDMLTHLLGCHGCQDRITAWNERPRLDDILRAAGNSDVACVFSDAVLEADNAVTNAYATTPLRQIGQYVLLKSLGRGGGGEVFEARHLLLQRRVAVKLLSPRHSGDHVARQRFFREMESIGKLNDPNVVHAYDAGEIDGTLYLAMELVDGENLESLARRLGQMPIPDACEIIRQAATGLQHVMETGLVHRDLKPSNLLVSRSGVKIADLGLALLSRGDPADDRLTGEKTVLGTADYMAPEQAEGSHEVDIRADLYSLGCTLFRLLAGRAPYAIPENRSPLRKMWAHASDPIPDILQLRPDVPRELAAILRTLMAKNREERLAEPWQLAEALAPYCHGLDPLLIEPAGRTPSASRSSTARGTTSAQPGTDAGQMTVQQMTPVQPPSDVRSPRLARAAAVVACLLIAAAWWILPKLFRGTDTAGPQPLVAHSSTHPGQPPTAPLSHEQPPALPSPVETIWQNAFGVRPGELTWRGRVGAGSWRLDTDLEALVIQSNQSIRLVNLGEIHPEQIGTVRLGVDATPVSSGGSFGIFLGFREVEGDPRRIVEFQVIELDQLGVANSMREMLVRRCLKYIDGQSGAVGGEWNEHLKVSLPLFPERIRFEVVLRDDLLSEVTLNGISCEKLCSSPLNSQYSLKDYCGRFGIFAQRATVEFRKPLLSRASE